MGKREKDRQGDRNNMRVGAEVTLLLRILKLSQRSLNIQRNDRDKMES